MGVAAMQGAGRPAEPVAALSASLDAVLAEVPADLPGPVALERARILLAEAERLRTAALLALADVDTRGLHTEEGVATTAAWVEGLAIPGLGRGDVTLARRLPRTPRVADALLDGTLGSRGAARVAAAVTRAGPHLDRLDGLVDGQPGEAALRAVLVDGISSLLAEQSGGAPPHDPQLAHLRGELEAVASRPTAQRDRLEAGLVLLAQRSQPRRLAPAVELLLDALLPGEHDERARAAEDAAELDLARDPLGGGWLVRGWLDDLTGEMLATVLAAEEAVDAECPADTQAWREAATGRDSGDLATLPVEQWPAQQARPRNRGARALSALRSALRRLLDTGALGSRDKAAPHLVVTTSLDALQGRPGALPARAAHGSPLTRRQLTSILDQTVITRLVLDPARRVLEASHTQRTATALERLVVHTQWGGRCARDGCARGPSTGHRLRPHHADPWTRSGRTAVADTVPLCDADHHHLHDDRIALRLGDGRWIGPDGWLTRESA